VVPRVARGRLTIPACRLSTLNPEGERGKLTPIKPLAFAIFVSGQRDLEDTVSATVSAGTVPKRPARFPQMAYTSQSPIGNYGTLIRAASLRLDVRCPDHLDPFLQLDFDLRGEFLWCIPNRLEAKRYQALLYVWQCHALGDLAIEMRDDLARRSGGDEDTEPIVKLNIRIAGFCHGWHVGERLQPRPVRHR
jgi:hypothetical protein